MRLNTRFLILFVLLVLALVALGGPVAHAQGAEPPAGGDVVSDPVISPAIPTAATIGAAVSFLLAFVPILSTWFKELNNTAKRRVLFVTFFLVGIVIFFASNPVDALARITLTTIFYFAQNVLAALGASQLWNDNANLSLKKPDGKG